MADYQLSMPGAQVEATLTGAVVFNSQTKLTERQKAQARENIGAGTSDSGMTILGYFGSLAELETAVTAPATGAAYGVGQSAPYDIYIWDALNSEWKNNGQIRGADGTNGEDANVTAGAVVAALGFRPDPEKLYFINTAVLPETFFEQGEPISEDYPYMAAVPLAGVTVDMVPEVIFSLPDAVSGRFAPAAASYDGGVYIYATEVPEAETVIPTIMLWQNVPGVEGGLPSDYMKVEYVESTGAYINTGVIPGSNTRVYAKAQFMNTAEGYLLGSQSGTSASDKFTFKTDGSGKYIGGYGSNDLSINTTPEQPFILDLNKTAVRVAAFETEHEAASFSGAYPMFLFAVNNGGSAAVTNAEARIYSCNIYDNDKLVRQFIPCFRRSDFAAGLFDLVTQLFYAPVVGTLAAGNIV